MKGLLPKARPVKGAAQHLDAAFNLFVAAGESTPEDDHAPKKRVDEGNSGRVAWHTASVRLTEEIKAAIISYAAG